MNKASASTAIEIAAAVALVAVMALAAPKKIASVKVDEDLNIEIDTSSLTNLSEVVAQDIAAATNALAAVAHTGSYTNLYDRPIEMRACVDGDGVTRYRLFSTGR